MKHRTATQKGGALFCSLVLSIACIATPRVGLAESTSSSSIDEPSSQTSTLVAKIEDTTVAYRAAEAEVENLEQQIAQNEKREAELKRQLPIQRAHTAASIKSMYLFQQSSGSLLQLILSSNSFSDFLSMVRYIDAIHTRNVEQINNLVNMVDELGRTQAMLTIERDAAIVKREEALDALERARAVRAELQARAVAVAASEEAGREEAIQVAQQAIQRAEQAMQKAETPTSEDSPAKAEQTTAEPSDTKSTDAGKTDAKSTDAKSTEVKQAETPAAESPTFTTTSGNKAVVEVPTTPSVSTEPLLTNTTSEETADWTSRINEYLKGSPLEGYGSVFAEAAATYGVDPRLSPAIATIESGKGEICFKEHNAWGWGSSSWDSWEDAIYEQVEGLATGYDGTLTLEGAERYCPPNYQEWYSSVASEMDGI